MVNLMRRYRQQLLSVVTVFVIITFAWLYNDYRIGSGRGEGKLATIYDRNVFLTDYQRGLRRMQMCQEMQLFDLVGGLAGNARTMDEAQRNFVFGAYVLRHEADTMLVEPTHDDVFAAMTGLPIFKTNGTFDRQKYDLFTARLGSLGFSTDQIEEAVADSLRLGKLKDLVSSCIVAAPSELRAMYAEENQKVEASFVRLTEELVAKDVQVSEDDLKKAFEERKATFQTDQLRKVRYVALVLSEEEKKLSGKERAAALQKLVDKASDFAVAMTEKGAKFDEVAKKFSLTAAETPDFSRAAPPKELGNSSAATAAAFDKLTMEQPNGDPVPSERRDGYYIMQLVNITPSRPETFDEVKSRLSAQMQKERISEKLTAQANEARRKIDEELKSGKSFADAAKAVGLTAETIPAFSQAEPPKGNKPGYREVQGAAAELSEGQLSEVISAGPARLICRVDKRLPIDESAFEKEKTSLAKNLSQARGESAFQLWFAERRKAANIQTKLGES